MMLDLGQDAPDYGSPAMASKAPDTKRSYPSLYFTYDKECDLPDEGMATIKFRKIEDSENTRDPSDPKYRYELEVQGIDVKGMKTADEPDTDFSGGFKKAIKDKRAIVIEGDEGDDE